VRGLNVTSAPAQQSTTVRVWVVFVQIEPLLCLPVDKNRGVLLGGDVAILG